MAHFIANLPDGSYFVYILEYTDDGYVIVETLDGKQFEVKIEDLILT